MQKNRLMLIAGFGVAAMIVAGLLAQSAGVFPWGKKSRTAVQGNGESTAREGIMNVRVYFPEGPKLKMESRSVERVFAQKKILKAAMTEFLKGPSQEEKPSVPSGSILLGVYIGNDGIAYLNVTEDFKRNFQGDAAAEFLLLKSLYETAVANANVDDIKILIDNNEIDTIGGHFSADRPLKKLVTQEIRFD